MAMELTVTELDAELGGVLPAREALGLFNINVTDIDAVNTALSANVLSGLSIASATAGQSITVITS